MLDRVGGVLGGSYLLPSIYPIVRDVLDANNHCGTADGIYHTLIQAVEVLVPREVAKRVRAEVGIASE